eukprot:CAMPEP_0168730342 /NCGR_PEP_ID=MMETSP0724-20121128/6681_1 /TAXON_ID=265536 /ORGANISM="Amphiprora sp., Strain CCMP467" /LENGTH=62 /DNA_ID=CAMNT_0008777277 /DNA_START=171 /DNA_END=356 /DNA_ORIENTATION=-
MLFFFNNNKRFGSFLNWKVAMRLIIIAAMAGIRHGGAVAPRLPGTVGGPLPNAVQTKRQGGG